MYCAYSIFILLGSFHEIENRLEELVPKWKKIEIYGCLILDQKSMQKEIKKSILVILYLQIPMVNEI